MSKALRTALRVGLFPVLFVGFVSAALPLMRRHNPDLVALAVLFGTIPLFFALERVLPWRRAWLGSRGDVHVDVGLFGLAVLLGALLVGPLANAAGLLALGWLSQRLGAGLWPEHWPLVAQGGLVLLVGDFFRYWFHRAEHEWEPLWRIHATHHACERLYFFNGTRLHPLEIVLTRLFEAIPLIALGVPLEALAMRDVMGRVIGRFQHGNLDVALGPLDYVFSSPANHRWHHSRIRSESNHNYGGDLIVWDLLFGTFYLPRDREPPDQIGIEDRPGFPKSLPGVLLSPFRWSAAAS
jgi:sterol desaturase/sphingolipid hydroxylase (fatty acid hydroxylase superfamily)